MKKLGLVLPGAVDTKEALRAVRARRVFQRWPDIVGPEMATRSFPDRWDRGTLYVAVTGSAWAQELRLMREPILARLAEIAGDSQLFVQVRFGVRPLPDRTVEEPVSHEEEDARIASLRPLSIREIAARRLANWPTDAGKGSPDGKPGAS